MDQFTAHLDRGWDLAQRGDAEGAETSARRALEIDSDSPEAHNLLGFAHALRGDHDDAFELYQQAIALDDTYLEALLNAAELCIHPLADLEVALGFCTTALQLVEDDEELTDALLLQFDALLGLGREEEAKATCERLPDGPYENPVHWFLVGRAYFEIGCHDKAAKLLHEAGKKDPTNPEVQYYMGMILDEGGDGSGATSAFLRSLELESQLPPLPWALSRDAFTKATMSAVEKLNPRLKAFVTTSEIYVADAPGIEVVVEGADPRTPVLLDALEGDRPALRVFVYQKNVERICGNADGLPDTIVTAMEREIATAVFGEIEAPSPESGTLN